MYENRMRPVVATGLIWLSGVVGYSIGSGIRAEHDQISANDRVEAVQKYNAQLQRQLAADQTGRVVRLILNDEAQRFSFDTTGKDGQAETCRGDYQVKNSAALATGKIACTVTSSISK